MKISMIVAVAEGSVIGRRGELPWRLPADFRRFKDLTMGHHLLMGRKTFEAIGRALPGRTTVVISRGRPEVPDGVRLASSLSDALAIAAAAGDPQPFIAGGGEIYREALPLAARVYLTRVHARVDGDAHFPDLDPADWRLAERDEYPADDENPHDMSFLLYERRQ